MMTSILIVVEKQRIYGSLSRVSRWQNDSADSIPPPHRASFQGYRHGLQLKPSRDQPYWPAIKS